MTIIYELKPETDVIGTECTLKWTDKPIGRLLAWNKWQPTDVVPSEIGIKLLNTIDRYGYDLNVTRDIAGTDVLAFQKINGNTTESNKILWFEDQNPCCVAPSTNDSIVNKKYLTDTILTQLDTFNNDTVKTYVDSTKDSIISNLTAAIATTKIETLAAAAQDTANQITALNLASYALKTYVESSINALGTVATQTWVQNQNYLTSSSIPSNIATQTWVDTQISALNIPSGMLATQTWVQSYVASNAGSNVPSNGEYVLDFFNIASGNDNSVFYRLDLVKNPIFNWGVKYTWLDPTIGTNYLGMNFDLSSKGVLNIGSKNVASGGISTRYVLSIEPWSGTQGIVKWNTKAFTYHSDTSSHTETRSFLSNITNKYFQTTYRYTSDTDYDVNFSFFGTTLLRFGYFIGSDGAVSDTAAKLYLQLPPNVIVNSSTYVPTMAKHIATKDYVDLGVVPVGAEVTVPKTITLPANFLKCDGSTVTDTTTKNKGTNSGFFGMLQAAGRAQFVLPNRTNPDQYSQVIIRYY